MNDAQTAEASPGEDGKGGLQTYAHTPDQRLIVYVTLYDGRRPEGITTLSSQRVQS